MGRAAALQTHPRGWALELEPEEVDLQAMTDHVDDARQIAMELYERKGNAIVLQRMLTGDHWTALR